MRLQHACLVGPGLTSREARKDSIWPLCGWSGNIFLQWRTTSSYNEVAPVSLEAEHTRKQTIAETFETKITRLKRQAFFQVALVIRNVHSSRNPQPQSPTLPRTLPTGSTVLSWRGCSDEATATGRHRSRPAEGTRRRGALQRPEVRVMRLLETSPHSATIRHTPIDLRIHSIHFSAGQSCRRQTETVTMSATLTF